MVCLNSSNDPQGKWKQQAYGGNIPVDPKAGQAATLQDADALDKLVPIPVS